MIADLSLKAMPDKRWWNIFNALKRKKDHQLRILYPAKVSFNHKGKMKSFSDTQEVKEFITNRLARNIKVGPSGRRKMTTDRSLALHRGMKSTRNHNYVGEQKILFLIIAYL